MRKVGSMFVSWLWKVTKNFCQFNFLFCHIQTFVHTNIHTYICTYKLHVCFFQSCKLSCIICKENLSVHRAHAILYPTSLSTFVLLQNKIIAEERKYVPHHVEHVCYSFSKIINSFFTVYFFNLWLFYASNF